MENENFEKIQQFFCLRTRGGIEDTGLEAKAKDPKNSEAKVRPFRGQGQGPRTQAQVFSKKKKEGLQKIFFRRS